MERKKKEAREYHVSTTDSPSWDVVQQQREGERPQHGEETERKRGAPPEEEINRNIEAGPGVSAPNRRS